MTIVLIDNYDSFVHNLARHVVLAGEETKILRNDAVSIADIKALSPLAIVISPGPCTPREAGISNDVVRLLGADIPILGVCLGHQCIGQVYGGNVVKAPLPVHGQSSVITHGGTGIFQGLPEEFEVGRYHSLAVEMPQGTPLRVTARTKDGVIMAFEHEHFPVTGVQFHPESILTRHGLDMLRNFIQMAKAYKTRKVAA